MLLSSFLLLVYAFSASATWIFNHDFSPEERSLLYGTSDLAILNKRQDDSESVTVAGGHGGGGGNGGGHGGHEGGHHHSTSTRTRTHTSTSTATPTGTPCAGNTPNTRNKWCSHSIDTNYHEVTPDTGITREYWLTLDEITAAPDGISRPAVAFNGTIPGPTIYADWGDEVVIHVKNKLHESINGSTVHWHGIRQQNTNDNDGVVSITQCPITPGHEFSYRWRAQQYGTSWYHSHIALQAWEGAAGALVINGPATANYEHDVGTIFLNDWPHQTAEELWWYHQMVGPMTLNNSLINGTNTYRHDGEETGEKFKLKVEKDSSYRLRLINGAIDTDYRFMIDNHTLTVIAMDLVPVEPFDVTSISIAMGQRYDVIVKTDQASVADSFWLRTIPQSGCSDIEDVENIRGIFHYSDEATTPETSAWWFKDECFDQPMDTLIPHIARNVDAADWQDNTFATVGRNKDNLFRWFLNSTTMEVFWENPTLLQITNGEDTFSNSSAVIELPNKNEWVYLVVNTTSPVTHPIHLHGHDFFILAQGTNPWDGVIKTQNPPRRDTAVLAANGYLVMAWETDNPGAWLMHCHIGWHTTEGFALQFVERYDEIKDIINRDKVQKVCNTWNGYDEEFDVQQYDSGV